MKKLMMAAIGLMMAISANAQYLNDSGTPFEQGKFYVGASMSSASLHYSKASDFSFGLNGKVGYMIINNLMGVGVLGIDDKYNGDEVNVELGAGARWYFDQIGIFAGATAFYVHQKKLGNSYNDFQPEINAGYAFFLGRHVTLEPEAYYRHSFKEKDNCGFGLRIGIGIYF